MNRLTSRLLVMILAASLILQAAAVEAAGTSRVKLPPLDQTLGRIKTQIIVVFKPDVSASQANAALAAMGGSVKKSASSNTRLVEYGNASEARAALSKLNSAGNVVYAFYNQKVSLPPDQANLPLPNPLQEYQTADRSISATPTQRARTDRQFSVDGDSLRTYQWNLDRIGENLAPPPSANAPVVAVVDSGMDYTSPDLSGQRVACPVISGLPCDLVEYDQDPMDTNGHGTHVAGIIAAKADAAGIVGVSPRSKILPVRIFGDSGDTDLMTIFQALDYVRLAKAKLPSLRVLNMSVGGYMLAGSSEQKEYNRRLAALKAVGVLPVVAAGNESDYELEYYPMVEGVDLAEMPAQSPFVLAVAATDQDDYRTVFSNYSNVTKLNSCKNRGPVGYNPDACLPGNTYTTRPSIFAPVAAPGWGILSTTPRGRYEEESGTSMASPLVAGAAARVMSRFPNLTNNQAAARILSTGVPLGVSKGFPIVTSRLDLRRALGTTSTGFTGRVVDGVSGQPLAGATVKATINGRARAAVTNGAGFYTLTGATDGTSYNITASKAGFAPYSAKQSAVYNQLATPGDISLVPVRTDGSYTIALDWNNASTGLYEYSKVVSYPGYPWFVNPSRMPYATISSSFGVPYPAEMNDSVEFTSIVCNGCRQGTLSGWPYARAMHDPYSPSAGGGGDLSPHEGTVVRKLPPSGSARFGVMWYSPAGPSKTGAVARLYRDGALLKRSVLKSATAPTDGTPANGAGNNPSVWALYSIASNGDISTPTANPNGMRTDYGTWIYRNNNIRGVPGPKAGGSVTARLDDTLDKADVYSLDLQAGKTYTFKLSGDSDTNFDLYLFGPSSLTTSDEPADLSRNPDTSTERIAYTVPAGQGGKYYLAVEQGTSGSGLTMQDTSSVGRYTLSRP